MKLQMIVFIVFAVILVFSGIKKVTDKNWGVVVRLGKIMPLPKGPGIHFILPFIDSLVMVPKEPFDFEWEDLEVKTEDQKVFQLTIQAQFEIADPAKAYTCTADWKTHIGELSVMTIRSFVSKLSSRKSLSDQFKTESDLFKRLSEVLAGCGVVPLDLYLSKMKRI